MAAVVPDGTHERFVGLFGREAELVSMRDVLLDPVSRKILVGGISGIGKTSTLRQLSEILGNQKDVSLSVEITSTAQSPAEVVQQLSSQLAGSDSVREATVRQFFSELKKRPIKNAYRLGMALLGDVAKAKFSSAEGTIQEVGAILAETDDTASTDAQAQALSEAGKDDLVLALRELLQAVSTSGKRGALVIDGLENASSAVVDTALALLADLPDNWCISLAVNTERSNGPAVFMRLSELLVYRGGEALELRGLERDAVLSWMKTFNPAGRQDHEVENAIAVTQGRPLYLKDWLSGTELDQVTLALGKRVAPAYQARFTSLSPQAQAYLARLCVLPKGLANLSSLASVLSHKVPDFNAVAVHSELKSARFLEVGVDQGLQAHDEVREQILSILGSGMQQQIAQDMLRRIESLDLEVASRDVDVLRLRATAGQKGQVKRDGELVAAKYLRDNPDIADQTYDLIAGSQVDEMTGEEGSLHLLDRAKALIGAGKYLSAIELVDQADASGSSTGPTIESNQTRLKALLRLNRYPEARTIAEHILKLLKNEVSTEYVEALRVLNTVYRDLGDRENATSSAKKLKRIVSDVSLSDKEASRIWRSVARTYAIFRPEKSVKAAKEALRLADRSGVLREVGNAYLALGEARRHSRRFAAAIEAYEEAARIALALGNVDSLLWSILGVSDAQMMSGEIDAARVSIGRLEPFFSDAGRRHPLEAMHWQLSQVELSSLIGEPSTDSAVRLVDGYEALGIKWPRQYVKDVLQVGKVQPKPI